MTDTITLVRGGDYPIPAALRDGNGDLIADIGAWTIKADAINASSGAVLATLTVANGKVAVGATAADITFMLSASDVALLPLGRLAKLRVTLTDSQGRDYVSSAWLSVSRDGEAQSGAVEPIALQFSDAAIQMSFDARQGPAGAQGAPGVNPAGAVLYDQPQSLTDPQKAQALANIGAGAASAILAAIAALTPAAGDVIYATAAAAFGTAASTGFGRSILNAADAAAARALIGAVAQTAFAGDSGSGGTIGLVPAPAAGDAAGGKVLKADGTWSALAQANIAGLTTADVARFAGLQFSTDVVLARDAANILALRNGANPQHLRVYNTFTDSANGEWLSINWSDAANTVTIGPKANGTGTTRNMRLAGLSFVSAVINGSNIGRFSNADGLGMAGGFGIRFYSDANFSTTTNFITPRSNGVITLQNATSNGFDRLQFGNTSSAYPALKVNGAALAAKLADDSAYTQFAAATLVTVPVAVASLPAAAAAGAGARAFVSDATQALPAGLGAAVAGGGTNKVPVYSDGTTWLIG